MLVLLALLLIVLAFAVRHIRTALSGVPAAVLVAAAGAVLCTAYSGGTSWAFARDHLDMPSVVERGALFAAGEMELFSMTLMARQNLRTTGAPGVPGFLVRTITAVQVIPAFTESGIIAGRIRAFAGPTLAALLWHLAMGMELRRVLPGADSERLSAIVVREARERLMARFGLSRRERDAVLCQLSAYRNARELATLPLPSPWRTGAPGASEMTSTVVLLRLSGRRSRSAHRGGRQGNDCLVRQCPADDQADAFDLVRRRSDGAAVKGRAPGWPAILSFSLGRATCRIPFREHLSRPASGGSREVRHRYQHLLPLGLTTVRLDERPLPGPYECLRPRLACL